MKTQGQQHHQHTNKSVEHCAVGPASAQGQLENRQGARSRPWAGSTAPRAQKKPAPAWARLSGCRSQRASQWDAANAGSELRLERRTKKVSVPCWVLVHTIQTCGTFPFSCSGRVCVPLVGHAYRNRSKYWTAPRSVYTSTRSGLPPSLEPVTTTVTSGYA